MLFLFFHLDFSSRNAGRVQYSIPIHAASSFKLGSPSLKNSDDTCTLLAGLEDGPGSFLPPFANKENRDLDSQIRKLETVLEQTQVQSPSCMPVGHIELES